MKIKTLTIAIVIIAFAAIATPVHAQRADAEKRTGLETIYDRFEDRTTVWVPYDRVYVENLAYQNLRVTAFFTYRGKTAGAAIESMGLLFRSTTHEWAYLKSNNLNVIIDGERLALGPPSGKDSNVASVYGGVQVDEVLEFKVAYSDLKKIAYARKVEMRLGPAEFDLHVAFLRSIQTLLSGITPPAVAPTTKKRRTPGRKPNNTDMRSVRMVFGAETTFAS